MTKVDGVATNAEGQIEIEARVDINAFGGLLPDIKEGDINGIDNIAGRRAAGPGDQAAESAGEIGECWIEIAIVDDETGWRLCDRAIDPDIVVTGGKAEIEGFKPGL